MIEAKPLASTSTGHSSANATESKKSKTKDFYNIYDILNLMSVKIESNYKNGENQSWKDRKGE